MEIIQDTTFNMAMKEKDPKCSDKDMEIGANAPFGLGSFSQFLKNRDPVKTSKGFKRSIRR